MMERVGIGPILSDSGHPAIDTGPALGYTVCVQSASHSEDGKKI